MLAPYTKKLQAASWHCDACILYFSDYCKLPLIAKAAAPIEYLIKLIAAYAGGGFFILKEFYNAIREKLGNNFLIFFFPMSRLERCFVSSYNMQKIKEISIKYDINLDDEKNVRKMLLAFEDYNKNYETIFAFFSGENARLGKKSALHHHFFKSELYSENAAKLILEFTGNHISNARETPDESVIIRLAS